MNDSKKVLDKIQKLLALSNNNSNVHEAGVAAKMAQELMLRHNISECMISEVRDLEAEEEIIDWGKMNEPLEAEEGNIPSWKGILARIVAEENSCKVYLSRSSLCYEVRTISIVGRQSDVGATRYIYSFLVSEIDRLCDTASKGKGKSWANNFRMGAVIEIKQIFQENRIKVIEQVKKENALAVANAGIVKLEKRLSDVQSWLDANMNLRKGKTAKGTFNKDAQEAGKAAARTINLGRTSKQLGAGTPSLKEG